MAETGAQQEATKEARVPSYSRERVLAESASFGYPAHVVAAALTMGRNANKGSFTRDELERAVDDFNNHVIEFDHPRQEG